MPPKPPKDFTQRAHIERREFAFTRNGVNLSFSLRVDIKQELKDFAELLKAALVDVQAELDKKKTQ